ncbi:MAG: hypothetical protein H6595_05455 [Flavobacteriales bacterium]|nr:hypothetical protein [Flavobacteriales bacterium]MCB9166911.1 hypothetical protein [Flavobacteriales bacterium]MCB9182255.1 hypothetical protein [Flavobacteriales bacterium]
MRIPPSLAPALLAPFLSCTTDPAAEAAADGPADPSLLRSATCAQVRAFDLVQHTCAMYVAVRSHAWEEPIAFGRDVDDAPVHWNKCPGGTMVACRKAPSTNGDTVITGLAFP